jgi:endo-1,4-beta-xylanase
MNIRLAVIVAGFVALTGCATAQSTLKEVFREKFLIGAALNPTQFTEQNAAQTALIKKQFNSITAENAMKWEKIHPAPGQYDFTPADRFVEFGERGGMAIIGHTLVWHSQTPKWVFEDGKGGPASRDTLLARMSNHIHSVVGRYKGRIKGWDVVNEALDEDGSLRQSPWLKILGEDYLVKAFEFAHAADPKAELYYNDYGLESERKRLGVIRLIERLQRAGVKVTAVGVQGHYGLDGPKNEEIEQTIVAISRLGIKVAITELDVNVLPTPMEAYSADISLDFAAEEKWNPYRDGLSRELEQSLALRYKELFKIFLKHRQCVSRVTVWGVTDGDSWLNDWPIRERTNYPLLFDRKCQPKAAFEAIMSSQGPALGLTD